MERRLSHLAVMDFRFLATLGMTGRRDRIVAASPFCLPLSAPARGETLVILTLVHIIKDLPFWAVYWLSPSPVIAHAALQSAQSAIKAEH